VSTVAHPPADQPIIPMPELTLPALRQAVATVAPGRLPELFDEMQQAFAWAADQDSIAPLRVFLLKWGTVVNIERIPSRAARFHSAEHRAATAERREDARAASAELGVILAEAQREITG